MIELVKTGSSINLDDPEIYLKMEIGDIIKEVEKRMRSELIIKVQKNIEVINSDLKTLGDNDNNDRKRFLKTLMGLFMQFVNRDEQFTFNKPISIIVLYLLEKDGVVQDTELDKDGNFKTTCNMRYSSSAVTFLLNRCSYFANDDVSWITISELLMEAFDISY